MEFHVGLRFAKEPRHLVIGLATDGFLPFADDAKYSCWPLVFTPYNFPPSWRCKLGFSSVFGIVPGTHDPATKVNIQPFLDIFIDECRYLEALGWVVYDKHANEEFRCYVKLIQLISDYRLTSCCTSTDLMCC
jgi:hypothetical protein